MGTQDLCPPPRSWPLWGTAPLPTHHCCCKLPWGGGERLCVATVRVVFWCALLFLCLYWAGRRCARYACVCAQTCHSCHKVCHCVLAIGWVCECVCVCVIRWFTPTSAGSLQHQCTLSGIQRLSRATSNRAATRGEFARAVQLLQRSAGLLVAHTLRGGAGSLPPDWSPFAWLAGGRHKPVCGMLWR